MDIGHNGAVADWGTASKRDVLFAVGLLFGTVVGSILTRSSFAEFVAALVGTGLALCIIWVARRRSSAQRR